MEIQSGHAAQRIRAENAGVVHRGRHHCFSLTRRKPPATRLGARFARGALTAALGVGFGASAAFAQEQHADESVQAAPLVSVLHVGGRTDAESPPIADFGQLQAFGWADGAWMDDVGQAGVTGQPDAAAATGGAGQPAEAHHSASAQTGDTEQTGVGQTGHAGQPGMVQGTYRGAQTMGEALLSVVLTYDFSVR